MFHLSMLGNLEFFNCVCGLRIISFLAENVAGFGTWNIFIRVVYLEYFIAAGLGT